jgi:hypothetical protein
MSPITMPHLRGEFWLEDILHYERTNLEDFVNDDGIIPNFISERVL